MSRLDEIKERLRKTTEGKWILETNGKKDSEYQASVRANHGYYICELNQFTLGGEHDGIFIAHAKRDIKYLMRLVEELQAEIKFWTEEKPKQELMYRDD